MRYIWKQILLVFVFFTFGGILGNIFTNSVYGQFKIDIPKVTKPTPMPTPEITVKTSDGQNVNNSVGQKRTDGQQPIIPGFYNFSATEPLIDKTTFLVYLFTHTNVTGQGEQKEWAFTPSPRFTVYGPIEAGSTASVSYTLPNGAAWFEESCSGTLPEVKPGYWYRFECEAHNAFKESKRTTQIGTVGFKVMLNNELSGKKTELMAGKFKVEKWVDNKNYPKDPNFLKHFVYYPKLDWKFPMAMIYTSPPKDIYDTNGPLFVTMWFRGSSNDLYLDKFVGYLFYQGKQVAATNAIGSNNVTDPLAEECIGYSDSVVDSKAILFHFNADLYDKDPNSGRTFFPIYKNPGEYEVKILQNGKLARVAKFTVDSSGNVVNNGINKDNKLGTSAILVPAQIIGEQDTKLDKTAWQTEGYWGTPLTGFTAP